MGSKFSSSTEKLENDREGHKFVRCHNRYIPSDEYHAYAPVILFKGALVVHPTPRNGETIHIKRTDRFRIGTIHRKDPSDVCHNLLSETTFNKDIWYDDNTEYVDEELDRDPKTWDKRGLRFWFDREEMFKSHYGFGIPYHFNDQYS